MAGESSLNPPDSRISPRHFRVGITLAQLTSTDLNGPDRNGAGITTFWDFETSARSSLGIHAAYRSFAGEDSPSQLGYGLIMKHYVGQVSSDVSGWYVNYGLLMQVLRIRGVEGSGTAHDTKLSAGYDWGDRQHWFGEASYHFSRLQYFDASQLNVDYFEIALGCRIH